MNVDKVRAKKMLESEWNFITKHIDTDFLDATAYAKEIQQINEVISGKQLTYKYILLTGALAKAVNPRIHYRALQMGSKLQGAYDARSLGHSVIVPFEKSHSERFGGSNEPFLNRPARYPEFDLSNRDRNRSAQRRLYYLLENAQGHFRSDKNFPRSFLRQVLKAMYNTPPTKIEFEFPPARASLQSTVDIVNEFLSVSGKGERLVAVSAAVFDSMYSELDSWRVVAYPVNWPDKFAKTAGDIEFYLDGKIVRAAESKDKPISESDMRHCSDKAKKHRIAEYMILNGAGIVEKDLQAIGRYIKAQLKKGINLYVLDVPQQFFPYFVYLGEKGRRLFVSKVGDYLNEIKARRVNKKEWARLLKKYFPA